MSEKTKFIIFLAFALIIFNGTLSLAVADDDHKEKNGIKKSWTMVFGRLGCLGKSFGLQK